MSRAHSANTFEIGDGLVEPPAVKEEDLADTDIDAYIQVP